MRLDHGGGIGTGYAHMSRIAVAPGMAVRRGQVIGYVGSTGLSTGAHLHYEMYRGGRSVDPRGAGVAQLEPALDQRDRTLAFLNNGAHRVGVHLVTLNGIASRSTHLVLVLQHAFVVHRLRALLEEGGDAVEFAFGDKPAVQPHDPRSTRG